MCFRLEMHVMAVILNLSTSMMDAGRMMGKVYMTSYEQTELICFRGLHKAQI